MLTREVIKEVVNECDKERLYAILGRLSNMEFKRSERMLREEVLSDLSNDKFWEVLYYLVTYRRQAFLSSVMAVGRLAKIGELSFDCEYAKRLYQYLADASPEAIGKLVSMALPLLCTEEQFDELFVCFHVDDPRDRIALLLRSESPLVYFVLFKNLKQIPDHQDLVRKCCVYIMKRDNDMAFNMASIMRSYFGISELKSNFSLRIEPYELCLIDRSYETFQTFLNGKRPVIR